MTSLAPKTCPETPVFCSIPLHCLARSHLVCTFLKAEHYPQGWYNSKTQTSNSIYEWTSWKQVPVIKKNNNNIHILHFPIIFYCIASRCLFLVVIVNDSDKIPITVIKIFFSLKSAWIKGCKTKYMLLSFL